MNIRGGAAYHLETHNAPIPSHASLGLGVKFASIHVDIQYLFASATLGGTLGLGLGYRFRPFAFQRQNPYL